MPIIAARQAGRGEKVTLPQASSSGSRYPPIGGRGACPLHVGERRPPTSRPSTQTRSVLPHVGQTCVLHMCTRHAPSHVFPHVGQTCVLSHVAGTCVFPRRGAYALSHVGEMRCSASLARFRTRKRPQRYRRRRLWWPPELRHRAGQHGCPAQGATLWARASDHETKGLPRIDISSPLSNHAQP